MIPVGAMAGFLGAALVTYVMPKKYESNATIEIKPRSVMGLDGNANSTPANHYATQFQKITSRRNFMRVVDALDLSNKWGMDRDMAVQVLREIVSVENIRGTDLYSIRVRHTNKEDARDIVAETVRAFRDTLTEEADEELSGTINAFKKAVREQEDRVEERRKVLTTTVLGDEDNRFSPERDQESKRKTNQDALDAKRDFETELGLLEKLKLKLISAEIGAEIHHDVVIVHDDPIIADSPISPNVTLNLLLGLVAGALLSPLLALPVMWMLNRRSAMS